MAWVRNTETDSLSACACSSMDRAAAEASSHPQSFKDAKRETARFYFARLLPRTLAHKAAIESGVANLMALDEAAFD